MTTEVIDLIAAREGSHKRLVAEALLASDGKALTLGELAKKVYDDEKQTGNVKMVLKGVAKAIEVHSLPFQLTREGGTVTLSSLEPKPEKKVGAKARGRKRA